MKKILNAFLIFLALVVAGGIVAVVYFSVSESGESSTTAASSSVASSTSSTASSSESSASSESEESESEESESEEAEDSEDEGSEIENALAQEAETKVLMGRELYGSWLHIDITQESQFLNAIHYMTHQKVQANSKQGALEITPERIDIMLGQAEAFSDSEHYPFYIEVLTAWDEEDFSNAVYAHNYVWNANDGDIGEAYALSDDDQEAAFVEANFRDVDM
ncbi:DUF6241 domain-containing protein [Aerococcus urinaeequi]|uniref:DUF6241 domain-containing protein n=1 Tax=Aerococcus urinaeequi TaxID=51665 RepID=UPI003EC4BC19